MYMGDSFSAPYPLLHLVNATHLCKKKNTNLVMAICTAAAREKRCVVVEQLVSSLNYCRGY